MSKSTKTPVTAIAIPTPEFDLGDLSSMVETLEKEAKGLKKLKEKSSSISEEVFDFHGGTVSIAKETCADKLEEAFAYIQGRETAMVNAKTALGTLKEDYIFKFKGHTTAEWADVIKLRIDVAKSDARLAAIDSLLTEIKSIPAYKAAFAMQELQAKFAALVALS